MGIMNFICIMQNVIKTKADTIFLSLRSAVSSPVCCCCGVGIVWSCSRVVHFLHNYNVLQICICALSLCRKFGVFIS
jgi:hypothetical protein